MKRVILTFLAAACVCAFASEESFTMADGWRNLRKDDAKAEKIFRQVAANAENETDKFSATTGIMYALRYQNKNPQVVKEVDAWLDAHKDASGSQIAKLCVFKGNALRDTGKREEALAAYKQGVDVKSEDASSVDCAKEYMWVAANDQKYELTVAMYELSSKLPQAQTHAVYLVYGAWCMWKSDKAAEGMKMLETAEKLPKLSDEYKEILYRHRGYIQRDSLKEYDAAVKSFENALALNINNTKKAVLWNNIGMAWENAQEYEKALEAYKKVATFNAKGWFLTSAANSASRMQKKIDAGE